MSIAVSCLLLGLAVPAVAQTPKVSETHEPSLRKAEADFVGKTIKNRTGATLGKVEDLMADMESARIAYAVVSLKSPAGRDERFYVLPWGTLTRGSLDDHVLADMPADKATACESFDKRDWPNMADANWATKVYKSGNQAPYWKSTGPDSAPRVTRVSEIVGMDVQNPQQENLGEVEELVIDTKNGEIVYAVVAFGGFLGMGDKLFAMPPKSLQSNASGEKLVLNVDKARLKAAPGFDKANWPDMANAEWTSQIRNYYGVGGEHAGVIHPDTKDVHGSVATYVKSSDLIGAQVKNAQGEDLGKVEDVVLDLEAGQIAYAVVSFGGFLGMGDKLFAVPSASLKRRAGDDTLVLNVAKERLEKAPGFDKNDWPSLSDRSWLVGVYEYYGVAPYWHQAPAPSDR